MDESLRLKPPAGGGFRLAEDDLIIGALPMACLNTNALVLALDNPKGIQLNLKII